MEHKIHAKVFDPYARIIQLLYQRWKRGFSIQFSTMPRVFEIKDFNDDELGTTLDERVQFLRTPRVDAIADVSGSKVYVAIHNDLKTLAPYSRPRDGKYNADFGVFETPFNVLCEEALTTTATPILSKPFADVEVEGLFRPFYNYFVQGVIDDSVIIHGPSYEGDVYGRSFINCILSFGDLNYPVSMLGVSKVIQKKTNNGVAKEDLSVFTPRVDVKIGDQLLDLYQSFCVLDGTRVNAEDYLLLLKYESARELYPSVDPIDISVEKIADCYFLKLDTKQRLVKAVTSVMINDTLFKNWFVSKDAICVDRGSDYGYITRMSKSSSCMICSLSKLLALKVGHFSLASTIAVLNEISQSIFELEDHVFVGRTASGKEFDFAVYENGISIRHTASRVDYTLDKLPEGYFLCGLDPYTVNKVVGSPDHWIVCQKKAGRVLVVYDPYSADPIPVGADITRALSNSPDTILAHFEVK